MVVVTADEVQPVLTAPSSAQNAVARSSASIDLGSLDVKGIGPWTVTVQWGDGQTSTFSPQGSGPLSLAHTYAQAGSYTISESVADDYDGSASVTFPEPVVVSYPAVLPTGVPVAAVAGISTGSVLVATFIDPGGARPTADYTAAISWGDGQSSTGTITYNGASGVFSVYGTHTYAAAGSDPIAVTVSPEDAPTATATSTATVVPSVTTTALSPSIASVVYGQSLTVTATVTGYGTPTGAVVLYLGAINPADQIGTGTLSVISGQDEVTFNAPVLNASGSPYQLTAVYGGDGNHQGSTSPAASLRITPAALKITANSQTMTYGGTMPTLTVTYTGLVNGDTAATFTKSPNTSPSVSTVPANSHAGTYAITASGAYDPDYTISYAAGTLTINPAPLTITASSQAMTYGGTMPTLTASYSGLVNGDTAATFTKSPNKPPALCTVPANSHAGTYTITASGAYDPDYAISYRSGTLTINPAALTIAANNQSKVYGQANPALTVSYSGFVNGDTSASLKTQPTVTTTATTTSPVSGSPYPINVSGAVNPDYTIAYKAGALSINPDATTVAATATGGAFGNSVTIAARVTANAPGSGTPTGSVNFFDATTGDDLGTVTLSGGQASLSTASLPPGSNTIKVSYSGDGNFLASSASTGTIAINPSVLVLDPTASGALTLSLDASIQVSGDVFVDSNSSKALSASGNASITAAAILVHGGVQKSGDATFHPAPSTGAAAVADPLAALPLPSTNGLKNYGSENLGGNSKATINPGIYSQINVSTNAVLTMNAGTYIIEGGGFTVTGNAVVNGSGVFIFNTGSNYPNSGGNFGGITVSSNGTCNLSASSTGTYAGILIFQPRQNTLALSLSGNAVAGLSGLIYIPSAALSMSGNAQLPGTVVADTVNLGGNATLTRTAAGSAATPQPRASSSPGGLALATGPAPGSGQSGSMPVPSSPFSTAAAGQGGSLSSVASSENAPSWTSLIAQAASPRPATGPAAQPAFADRADLARSVILEVIGADEGRRPGPIRPATDRLPDVLLDDLISDPVLARFQESDPLIVAAAPSMTEARPARAGRGEVTPDVLPLAAIPAGPMSRRESARRSAGLADVLLAAGFCGFGSGLRAARRAAEGRGSLRGTPDLDNDGAPPFPKARGRG